MLAVVDHEQQLALADEVGQLFFRWPGGGGPTEAAALRHAEPLRERGRDLLLRARARELDEPDAVRVPREQPPRELDGEPALARAADASERQQSRLAERRVELPQLGLAADEACARLGQVVARAGERGTGLVRAPEAGDAQHAHRPRDVLERALAEVLEVELEPAGDLLVGRARERDAARGCERLDARSHVDRVARDALPLRDHVAYVDADAQLETMLHRECLVPGGQLTLCLDGAGHGLDRARQLGQQVVADCIDDAATVRLDSLAQQCALGVDRAQRGRLVGRHQTAVPHGVGGEDRGETARHADGSILLADLRVGTPVVDKGPLKRRR